MAPQKFLRKGLQGILALTAILSSCISDDLPQPQADDLSTTPPITKQLSASQAQDVAKSFSATRFGVTPSMASRSSQTIETISDTDGTPLAYIVNTEGAGWAIVSATTDYYPILAYSDSSDKTFSLSDVPVDHPLNLWLDELIHAIRQSESLDSVTASSIAYEWMDYLPQPAVTPPTLPGGNSEKAVACRNRLKQLNDTYYKDGWSFTTLSSAPSDVRPYVTPLADSYDSPYEYTIVGVRKYAFENNSVEPLLTTTWDQDMDFYITEEYSYPGCVSVAMGQIMKFHRYPSYFDWDDMPDAFATETTVNFLHHIGKTIGADYSNGHGSAHYNQALSGFKAYGYQAELKDYSFIEVIKSLERNEPVYMRGDNKSGGDGHAWVCDGVHRTLYEHQYYVEFIDNSNGYTNNGETSLLYPPIYATSVSSTSFHMNWGNRGVDDDWYIDISTYSGGDFSVNRKNIFVSKP